MSEGGKENQKVNEKAIDINKSFDSRKTSVHGHRIINDSSKTNLSGFNTDRKKRYNDIENLSLFTLKDWKDSKIYKWY
jgi:predicted ester cyclase